MLRKAFFRAHFVSSWHYKARNSISFSDSKISLMYFLKAHIAFTNNQNTMRRII